MKRIACSFAITLLFAGALCAQDKELPRFGIGFRASSLGLGIEGATAVTRKSNFRAGFNAFSYSYDLLKDGIDYNATLSLRSIELHYDQYLIGGFHISPGVLIYDDNHATATAFAPPGAPFTLGGVQYFSSSSSPVTGNANMAFAHKVAPELLIGFGNLLPRSRHFGFNFEFGAAYQGTPSVNLNLAGTACATNTGVACLPVATTPAIQSNIASQQDKINHSIRSIKFWPIIAIGIGYKF